MTTDRILRLTQPAICAICAVLVWRYTLPLDGAEFSGGRITGPLLEMADLGMLLFALSLILSFFRIHQAAAVVLAACLLTLPLYSYFVFPGPFRQIFKGEYSVSAPLHLVWSWNSIEGLIALTLAATISLRIILSLRVRQQSPH